MRNSSNYGGYYGDVTLPNWHSTKQHGCLGLLFFFTLVIAIGHIMGYINISYGIAKKSDLGPFQKYKTWIVVKLLKQ
jgi:hypothetical protein